MCIGKPWPSTFLFLAACSARTSEKSYKANLIPAFHKEWYTSGVGSSCKANLVPAFHDGRDLQSSGMEHPESGCEESLLLQTERLTDFSAQLQHFTEEERIEMHAWPKSVRIGGMHPVRTGTDGASMDDAALMSSMCPLPWNENQNLPGGVNTSAICPHGKLLFGQVTLPNNASFREWISVFYSYVVFAVIVLAVLECIFTGPLQFRGMGTREASFILFVACIVAMTEWPLRLAISNMRPELSKRPDLSCNISCGMPSITSALAIGFLTLSVVDASFRVLPKMPRCAEDDSEHDATVCQATFWDLISFIPLSGADMITMRQLCGFATLWSVVLVPVPCARAFLRDHTFAQVLVGSICGAAIGFVWFGVTRLLQTRYNCKLGQRVFGIFEHNYPLPRYEVKIRCARLLLEGAPEAEVKQAEEELEWYTDCGRIEKQMSEVMARLTGSPILKDKSPSGDPKNERVIAQADSF